MSDECSHPSFRVVGRPDPDTTLGKTQGVWRRIGMDAQCTECGESVKVTYRFDGVGW